MADEENNEPKNKGFILRILIFVVAGLVLIGADLAAAIFFLVAASLIPLKKLNL